MSLSLTTTLVPEGLSLTFQNGATAGQIAYDAEPNTYNFEPPGRPDLNGPPRRTLAAAQYDALAWAEEEIG